MSLPTTHGRDAGIQPRPGGGGIRFHGMKGRAADRNAVTICRPDRTFDGYDAPTPARKRRRAGPRKPTRVARRPAPAQDPAMPRRGVRHAGRRAAARFPRQPTHFRQGSRRPGSALGGDPQPVAGPACPRTPTAWPGRGRPSHDQAGTGACPKVLQPARATGTIRSDERNTTGCCDAPTCRPKRAIRMRASAGPRRRSRGSARDTPHPLRPPGRPIPPRPFSPPRRRPHRRPRRPGSPRPPPGAAGAWPGG